MEFAQDSHQKPVIKEDVRTNKHEHPPTLHTSKSLLIQRTLLAIPVLTFALITWQFTSFYAGRGYGSCAFSLTSNHPSCNRGVSTHGKPHSNKEGYFAGPTATGDAPMLAETNPAPFESVSYIPNTPLETQVPIAGNTANQNIFQLHGHLSHYFPNPAGFGVDEYALPQNASIVQLNMLHRHGARYPTVGPGPASLAKKITEYLDTPQGRGTFKDDLDFLNYWTYKLGHEILVPIGHQELFDSGVLHHYMYGHLYPNNGSKIIVRSTTQKRMVQSAEYFLAGFFGLEWKNNATLVLAIESSGVWNNTLAGYKNCKNANLLQNTGGRVAARQWISVYLIDAHKRLAAQAPGFNWTITDTYNAQTLCAYETVALGYSAFCGLFTYEEWEGYEYSIDIEFAGIAGFESPTGRAVGIGYVQEVLARLEHHLIDQPTAQVNVTLDNNTATFPLHQTINLDFTHDTNILAVLTAFGLRQFAQVLPLDRIPQNRSHIISHMTPFAARLDTEIIETPAPLDETRRNGDRYTSGKSTRYIHFLLNQRTIPLGRSFPDCGARDDGWCELATFLKIQKTKLEEAQYEFACFGDYPALPYGQVTDGVPVRKP